MEHAVYANKAEPQPLAIFGHQTWALEWRDKYCATGEVRSVPVFDAIRAAREYYSASQIVVEEIGTGRFPLAVWRASPGSRRAGLSGDRSSRPPSQPLPARRAGDILAATEPRPAVRTAERQVGVRGMVGVDERRNGGCCAVAPRRQRSGRADRPKGVWLVDHAALPSRAPETRFHVRPPRMSLMVSGDTP